MNAVTVSVVVPAFNQAAYLAQALSSALNQTFNDLEVIVVDDGSTDETRQVCESFGDPRLRYIYQPNDRTMGIGARNLAILEACGEWIALLDQDDCWAPDKIEKQLRRAAEQPGAGAVFCRVRFIDGAGRTTGQQENDLPEGDVFHTLLGRNHYYAASGIFKRALLPTMGLPHASVGLGDHALWLMVARVAPVTVVDELLADYRVHEQGYQAVQRRAGLMRLADDAWQVSLLQATLLHRACAICRQAQIRSLRNVAQLYLIALRAKWEAGSFVGSSVAIKRIVIAERRRPGVLLRETLKLAGVALKGLIHPVT